MVHDGLWIAGHCSGNRISVSCGDVDHTRETIQDTQSNDRYVDEGYAAVFSETKEINCQVKNRGAITFCVVVLPSALLLSIS